MVRSSSNPIYYRKQHNQLKYYYNFSFTSYKDDITTIHYYYNSSPRPYSIFTSPFLTILYPSCPIDPLLTIEDDINFFKFSLNDTLYVSA